MSTYSNLPIKALINELATTATSPVTFQDLKTELSIIDLTPDGPKPKYNLSLKEDDDLCIIYHSDFCPPDNCDELTNSCRSIILDKKTLEPVVSQFNRIIYNEAAFEFMADKDWSKTIVQKCHEGTMIVIFNHADKWYVSTRRCLDANKSVWARGKSYYDMVCDAMKSSDQPDTNIGTFGFDNLDPKYCYHFVLVHHKNSVLVEQPDKHYELYHIMTTEKYTLKEVDVKINNQVHRTVDESIKSLNDMTTRLDALNKYDTSRKRISSEGFIVRYYTGELLNSPFYTLKFQSNIYKNLMKLKPNNSNLYQCFLGLYQEDKLFEFLPYFPNSGNVLTRINTSMRTVTKELFDIYHLTRARKAVELYEELPESYKRCLYGIHGIYLANKNKTITTGESESEPEQGQTPQQSNPNPNPNPNPIKINVKVIYSYLKQLPLRELVKIYNDRLELLDKQRFSFMNTGCIETMTMTSLMFKS